jgi:hypothetical protein
MEKVCDEKQLFGFGGVEYFAWKFIYYYYFACLGVGQDRVSYKTDVSLVGEKGGADLRQKEEFDRSRHLH